MACLGWYSWGVNFTELVQLYHRLTTHVKPLQVAVHKARITLHKWNITPPGLARGIRSALSWQIEAGTSVLGCACQFIKISPDFVSKLSMSRIPAKCQLEKHFKSHP